jgi:hypothetical protein
VRSLREAPDLAAAQRAVVDALPPLLASVVAPGELELMRQRVRQLPEPPERPGLTRPDWLGALAVCLLSFLSTFPIVIPFILIGDARLALRGSTGWRSRCCSCAVMRSGIAPGCGRGWPA